MGETKEAAKTETRTNLVPLSGARAPALRSSASDLVVTRGGRLQRVHDTVELRASRKEIYTTDRGATFTVTAEGFRKLNASVGIQLVLAATVPVDGIPKTNPHVVRNDLGEITDVWIRMAGIGRSLTGNLLVIPQTLHYSPRTYFIRDLYNVVRIKERWVNEGGKNVKKPGTPSDSGRLVSLATFDQATLKDYEVLYQLDDRVGVLVDLRSSDVNDVFANKNELSIFAVRKAQTICERRIMQAHPGMPRQSIPGNQVAQSWTEDEKEYKRKLIEAVAKLPTMGWVEAVEGTGQILRAAAAVETGEDMPLEAQIVEREPIDAAAEEPEEVSPATAEPPPTVPPPAAAQDPGSADLAVEVAALFARIKAARGGGRVVADLLAKHADGSLELIDQPVERLAALRAGAEEFLAQAAEVKKSADGRASASKEGELFRG